MDVRRAVLAAALWCSSAWAAGPASQPASAPTPGRVSVLTYNVNYGMTKPDIAVAAILEANADVVVLQETHERWAQVLRTRLASRYPHQRYRHADAAGGMAFLSRWPIVDVARRKPVAGWFEGWVVRIDRPQGPFQVLNVHLKPALDGRTRLVTMGEILRTQKVHRAEMGELFPLLDPAQPAIVAGDFNESEDGQAISFLLERGFRHAFAGLPDTIATWQWSVGPMTVRERMDNIVFSPHWWCVSTRVLPHQASDHFAVLAVLEPALSSATGATPAAPGATPSLTPRTGGPTMGRE